MDKSYADTVRLLLAVAPDVFANDIFAMKGGTAINLFVQDMPRLSVDIDVVYLPWQVPRDEALHAIHTELTAIAQRVQSLGVQTRRIRSKDRGDTKLIVENETSQVKTEVNEVFRGTVLPVRRLPVSTRTAGLFGVEFELPILATDELYAGKLVAALDRQHPRDLFDVWRLFESGGITDTMIECFVIYLAGHNRPIRWRQDYGNDRYGLWLLKVLRKGCSTMAQHEPLRSIGKPHAVNLTARRPARPVSSGFPHPDWPTGRPAHCPGRRHGLSPSAIALGGD